MLSLCTNPTYRAIDKLNVLPGIKGHYCTTNFCTVSHECMCQKSVKIKMAFDIILYMIKCLKEKFLQFLWIFANHKCFTTENFPAS